MTRLYLKEIYYCTLHLLKNGAPVTGKSPVLNIMRNSDGRFLKPGTGNWNLAPEDISLIERVQGIYTYSIDMSIYYNFAGSYTLIYKYNDNGVVLQEIEQVLFERRNISRLV